MFWEISWNVKRLELLILEELKEEKSCIGVRLGLKREGRSVRSLRPLGRKRLGKNWGREFVVASMVKMLLGKKLVECRWEKMGN